MTLLKEQQEYDSLFKLFGKDDPRVLAAKDKLRMKQLGIASTISTAADMTSQFITPENDDGTINANKAMAKSALSMGAQGAAAGMAFGPWSAAIGGVVGAGTGAVTAKLKADKQNEELKAIRSGNQATKLSFLNQKEEDEYNASNIQYMKKGGFVKGNGTPTSDSVKAKVDTGSFVLPSPGNKTVKLSDGELVIPRNKVAIAEKAANASGTSLDEIRNSINKGRDLSQKKENEYAAGTDEIKQSRRTKKILKKIEERDKEELKRDEDELKRKKRIEEEAKKLSEISEKIVYTGKPIGNKPPTNEEIDKEIDALDKKQGKYKLNENTGKIDNEVVDFVLPKLERTYNKNKENLEKSLRDSKKYQINNTSKLPTGNEIATILNKESKKQQKTSTPNPFFETNDYTTDRVIAGMQGVAGIVGGIKNENAVRRNFNRQKAVSDQATSEENAAVMTAAGEKKAAIETGFRDTRNTIERLRQNSVKDLAKNSLTTQEFGQNYAQTAAALADKVGDANLNKTSALLNVNAESMNSMRDIIRSKKQDDIGLLQTENGLNSAKMTQSANLQKAGVDNLMASLKAEKDTIKRRKMIDSLIAIRKAQGKDITDLALIKDTDINL
jgi:hypothetical protein